MTSRRVPSRCRLVAEQLPASERPIASYTDYEQEALAWPWKSIDETLNTMEWVEVLDEEDRAAMRTELVPLFSMAMATGEWRPYENALAAWRSTAEVVSDPELVERLTSPWDPTEEVPLTRP